MIYLVTNGEKTFEFNKMTDVADFLQSSPVTCRNKLVSGRDIRGWTIDYLEEDDLYLIECLSRKSTKI